MKSRILVVALVFLLAGSAIGQVLYGTLVGAVTDPQQAAVTGANVTLKNNATGYSVEAKTNERGGYEIPNIPPGVYDIRIAMSSFSSRNGGQVPVCSLGVGTAINSADNLPTANAAAAFC